MIEIEGRAKKWGNSLGIVLPKDVVKKEKIKENDKITAFIVRELPTAEGLYGMGKGVFKKSGQQLKDELRKELYDD